MKDGPMQAVNGIDHADLDAGNGRARPKKAPNAFRTISEVADDLHIPQHVLRFWETKFPQVKPLKRGGGRRYYRPDDINLLRQISDLLYTQGYTIKGVQRLLREGGGKLADNIPPPPPDEKAEVEQESEPQLPMPGLTLVKPPKAEKPAPKVAKLPPPADPDADRSSENARLRALLKVTLQELQALRAQFPD
jgi:DNA-binding transcriptional MerR regulator